MEAQIGSGIEVGIELGIESGIAIGNAVAVAVAVAVGNAAWRCLYMLKQVAQHLIMANGIAIVPYAWKVPMLYLSKESYKVMKAQRRELYMS